MKRLKNSDYLLLFVVTACLSLGSAQPSQLGASLDAVAVDGWNRIMGEPAVTLRFVGTLNFGVGGVFNPDGSALPVDSTTPLNAVMASYASPDVW